MTRDELEFSISQYLDGTLPLDEQVALQARLTDDADARALLAEYRQLQGVLKAPGEMPAIQWETLSSQISNAVAAMGLPGAISAFAGPSDTESLDELVVGYSDGDLPAEQRAAFEHRLSMDSNAAALLSQYRRLDTALQAVKTASPLPSVRWTRLAEHLSGVVADAGAKPVFSFKWARTAGRIAIAACALLVAGIGIEAYRGSGNTGANRTQPIAVIPQLPTQGFAVVLGPQPESASATPVLEIEIGGPAVAAANTTPGHDNVVASVDVDAGSSTQFADVIVARPSRVVIANGDNTAQDSAQMPY